MPEASAQHPSSRELADFGAGKLPHEEAARVAEHLTACGDCSTKVEQMPVDSFVEQLKAASPPGGDGQDAGLTTPHEPPAAPPGVPAELARAGKFEFSEKLGQGGMGAVWKARHTFLGKTVAIKLMRAGAGADAEARARFLREVRATARLRHPNIVQALDAAEAGEHLYLVMEYVEGITLDKLVARKGPFPPHFACRFIAEAADGLQHAHEEGMVHRDVKPSNLMVTKEAKQLKILDFGLVRGEIDAPGHGPRTQSQAFMGTPEFVAPEQATDARSADIRSDIYSLGCTLYFLLSGRPPFVRESALEVLLAHVSDEPQPLEELRPDLPPGLTAVVARMMAKKPGRRYQTPAEVSVALVPFKTEPSHTTPPPLPKDDSVFGSSRLPTRPWPGRRWPLVAAGLVVVGLLGAALAVLSLPGKQQVRERTHDSEPVAAAVAPPKPAPPPAPTPVQAARPAPRPGEPPDLSSAKVVFRDDFSNPRSGWPTGELHGYKNGMYFVQRTGGGIWGWNAPIRCPDHYACEVVGRVLGKAGDGWGLSIMRAEQYGPMIEIYHEGRVQSLASCFAKQKNSVPTLRAASHKALKPGSEWNTLLVVVRERRVQAFINGVAALEPFEATHKITPSVLSMLGMGKNKARAEFKRFTLWKLEPDGGG